MEKEALCEHLTTNDVDEEAIKKHMVAVSKAKYLEYFHYDRFLNARVFSHSQWVFSPFDLFSIGQGWELVQGAAGGTFLEEILRNFNGLMMWLGDCEAIGSDLNLSTSSLSS
jgi:hypothetical protein